MVDSSIASNTTYSLGSTIL